MEPRARPQAPGPGRPLPRPAAARRVEEETAGGPVGAVGTGEGLTPALGLEIGCPDPPGCWSY